MTIRLADEKDAPAIRAIYAPMVEETVVSFEDEPPSERWTGRRFGEIVLTFAITTSELLCEPLYL